MAHPARLLIILQAGGNFPRLSSPSESFMSRAQKQLEAIQAGRSVQEAYAAKQRAFAIADLLGTRESVAGDEAPVKRPAPRNREQRRREAERLRSIKPKEIKARKRNQGAQKKRRRHINNRRSS